MAELDAQDGGLEGVEPGVEADFLVVVLGFHAVDAQAFQDMGQGLVGGGHHAAVAEAAQVLRRVEAEGRGVAQGAGGAALVAGAYGLGRVFEDDQAAVPGQCQDGVHVGGLAVEVDRDDGAGAGGDGRRR